VEGYRMAVGMLWGKFVDLSGQYILVSMNLDLI
jgi:hypothetical protein